MLILPDLILETVIRDGLELVRREPQRLERIFGTMEGKSLQTKYGKKELNSIIKWIDNNEISIVQSFSHVNTNLPSISIQLMSDDEAIGYTSLGDYKRQETVKYDECDPNSKQVAVIIEEVTPTGYCPMSKLINIDDSVDLSTIHPNLIFKDTAGNEFNIEAISDIPGDQFLILCPKSDVADPDITGPGSIISSINSSVYEVKGTIENSTLMVGVHTKERLATIYLFNILKYFFLARKEELEANCINLSTFSGSDFSRNLDVNEPVFHRFFQFKSVLEQEWRGDELDQIDWFNLKTIVQDQDPISKLDNEDLDLENSTIQVKVLGEDD